MTCFKICTSQNTNSQESVHDALKQTSSRLFHTRRYTTSQTCVHTHSITRLICSWLNIWHTGMQNYITSQIYLPALEPSLRLHCVVEHCLPLCFVVSELRPWHCHFLPAVQEHTLCGSKYDTVDIYQGVVQTHVVWNEVCMFWGEGSPTCWMEL